MTKFFTVVTIIGACTFAHAVETNLTNVEEVAQKITEVVAITKQLETVKVRNSIKVDLNSLGAVNTKAQLILQDCKSIEGYFQSKAPEALANRQSARDKMLDKAMALASYSDNDEIKAEQQKLIMNLGNARYCHSLMGLISGSLMQRQQ